MSFNESGLHCFTFAQLLHCMMANKIISHIFSNLSTVFEFHRNGKEMCTERVELKQWSDLNNTSFQIQSTFGFRF